MSSTAIRLAIAALVAATTPAVGHQKSETVASHDLDLSAPQGIAALHQRISRAAHHVCDTPGIGGMQAMEDARICRQGALRKAGVEVAGLLDRAQRLASREAPAQIASR